VDKNVKGGQKFEILHIAKIVDERTQAGLRARHAFFKVFGRDGKSIERFHSILG
jgi:hypothetical protein